MKFSNHTKIIKAGTKKTRKTIFSKSLVYFLFDREKAVNYKVSFLKEHKGAYGAEISKKS